MIRASIDLGTNTGLMLLAEVESGQIKKVLGDYARIIRLGEGVDKTRSLQPEAIGRTLMCLAEYKSIISGAGISPGDVICVATSHARGASNGEAFFDKAGAMIMCRTMEKLRFPICSISSRGLRYGVLMDL